MKKLTSLIISALLVSGLIFAPAQAQATFRDVTDKTPFKSAIEYVEQKGIVNTGTFSPTKSITREEFASWILKNDGFNGEQYKPLTKSRFSDVALGANYYAPYIYKLVDLGVIEIVNGATFRPRSTILRRDGLAWILSLEGISVPKIFDETRFQADDVAVSSKDAPLTHKAIERGFLSPGKVRLSRPLSRAQAAHFLKAAQDTSSNVTLTIVRPNQSDIEENAKYDILNEAWNRINNSYLHKGTVDKEKLLYGAIEGIVKELGDKHSTFERPGNNAVIDSLSGEIIGIGAVIQTKDDEPVVVAPLVGSPADKAGLLPNDIIKEVNGVVVAGKKLTEVVALIKGPKGTQVRIKVLRGALSKEFVITRDLVKIVSVAHTRTEDNFDQIILTNFGDSSSSDFKAVVADIATKQTRGILLDLRNNPGGYLNTAIEIAGHFIKSGAVVTTVRYPTSSETLLSNGTATLAGKKMVVLVNGGSASASEILAGALQDFGLATIIGEKTYGKGTVQEIQDFSDGSTLKLTIAEWLTPKGRSIEHNGIVPDIVVPITDADRAAGRDPQKERALEELRK